jgi:hypothetical protein
MHAVELLGDIGVMPITTAFIQIDVGGCQQPVGWFDQVDPQWNVTQCALDKVKLFHIGLIIILSDCFSDNK